MYKYLVVSNRQVTPGVIGLTLKKDSMKPFSFVAGQYASISFYRKGRPTYVKCFSIASSPGNPEIIQFGIRVGGKFTQALQRLEPDDVVDVRGPFGSFILPANTPKALFLAGGIGITPFLSMIRHATENKLDTKIQLLYSCRTDADAAFAEEIIDLAKSNPNFSVKFILSDGNNGQIASQFVESGRITPELLDNATKHDYTNNTFYICGPPGFMAGMTQSLLAKNVSNSQIITEAFNQVAKDKSEPTRGWPSNVYIASAIGLAMVSLAVMMVDLAKTLPPQDLIEEINGVEKSSTTNLRQKDLNELVNELPDSPSNGAISPGTATANDIASKNASISTGTGASGSSGTSGAANTLPSTSGGAAPVAKPAPTPAPTPAPVTCGSTC